MRIELQLRGLQDDSRLDNPTVMVQATIEEGDSVTVGSQFNEEFEVASLAEFLVEADEAGFGLVEEADEEENDDDEDTRE